MQVFKLKFIELFVIILLSVPIGGFFYFNNLNKIKYDFEIKKGYAVTASLCENFSYDFKELLNNNDLDSIAFNYNNLKLNADSFLAIKIIKKNNIYKITLNGKSGQEKLMLEQFNKIFLDIKNQEIINFNKYFKSINFNCNSNVFPAFKIINSEISNDSIKLSKHYKDFHLFSLFLSPLLLIYLLFISYKYIRNKQ